MNGGELIAQVLVKQGVKFMFTLCGGHISPILSEAKALGIRIVDVRHEATAVFAADAVARLSGIPGVAAVTAGPGVTNTLTAVKNAQMAQSPLVLLGGAAATALKGRGALQDIDQMALIKPHVKWARVANRVADLPVLLNEAFRVSQEGVPGPVFLECPIDLLYEEELVRSWYGASGSEGLGKSLQSRLIKWYLNRHVNRLFKGLEGLNVPEPKEVRYPSHTQGALNKVVKLLASAQRPVMVIGSQALLGVSKTDELVSAVEALGIPVFLSGMARGMLGKGHPLQFRHKRRAALKETDVVILLGVPCDFRMNYGRHIGRKASYIAVNRDRKQLYQNRRPDVAILWDSGDFIRALGGVFTPPASGWADWKAVLKGRNDAREQDILQRADAQYDKINPLELFIRLEPQLAANSVIVADGGDFVATGSYILSPRGPLRWLDPGAFGTLGVGAGFALGAKLVYPDAEVWLIYGDGTCAYSIAEYDTFARHNLPVISVVGNDASWAQIARDQVEILKDDVATVLDYSNYDLVAEGYGGKGRRCENISEFLFAVKEAKACIKQGIPYLINAVIAKTDFRKGSISM